MAERTVQQYDEAIRQCEDIFLKKASDYGTSWRVLRPISVIDQIYIKAQRIRNIQEKGFQKVDKVGDDIRSEFIGIVNYSVIGLIQLNIENEDEEPELQYLKSLYDKYVHDSKTLMTGKNHDYGEAWRSMSMESFADLILMKLHRMRQIIANKGKTTISEGLDANYHDMINYAVFALIMISENEPSLS